ncbi:hypothetical protein Q6248_29860, partial [Klebsiella pneumoniae]|uniref:hypothetical protein n=1 Tax=Klebsiella pneumoniae TaxID=573 RepID=UPI002730CD36
HGAVDEKEDGSSDRRLGKSDGHHVHPVGCLASPIQWPDAVHGTCEQLFVGEHMAKDEPEGIGLETGRDERAGRLST